MLLAIAILVGLAASGLTAAVRAVVQEMQPLWLLAKPLSCDLCMSWWSSLGLSGALWASGEVSGLVPSGVVVLGGVGVSLISVKVSNRLSD